MKSFLIFLCFISSLAQASTCQTETETITVPVRGLYEVSMSLTSAQLDRCGFGRVSDTQFKSCLTDTFGALNAYQEGLPLTLAYIRLHNSLVSFDTLTVASGRMYYLSEFNPAYGVRAFVQFFDQKNNLVGQIYQPGLGAMLDCK